MIWRTLPKSSSQGELTSTCITTIIINNNNKAVCLAQLYTTCMTRPHTRMLSQPFIILCHCIHCISFHCISWRFITTQNAKVQLACLGVVQLQQSVQNVFCVMEILLRVCSTQHTDEGSNDCLLPAASSAMNYKTRCSSTSCKLQCVQGICGEITHDSQHPTQCKRHVCGFRTMG